MCGGEERRGRLSYGTGRKEELLRLEISTLGADAFSGSRDADTVASRPERFAC